MGKFYIFNSSSKNKEYNKLTVIFNPDTSFDFNILNKELSQHFKNFHQTSALLIFYCGSIKNIEEDFQENLNSLFKSIPKVEEESLKKSIFFISYDNYSFQTNKKSKFLDKHLKEIINQGLCEVFTKNGGLIESNGISHHFEFPSGKHSAKFLRTANVLVYKSEIDFIAINTLHLFEDQNFENIYCDTLSINVIAYSMTKYIRRFLKDREINIESFHSYEGIYNKNSTFYNKSIFLISASTSGGLIHYIQRNHPEIKSAMICTLFYLPIDKNSRMILERVLCNLERNEDLNYGIELFYQSKKNEKCKYCESHSTPIKILGDSFSLDEPIINSRNVTTAYISKSLKDFVETFKYNKEIGTCLKVSYSEQSIERKKYDLFIDYEKVISNITNQNFEDHKNKLDAYINQYIPASTKYIIHLNDKGSSKLSEYIHNKVKEHSQNEIQILNQSDLEEKIIDVKESGAILIVGSCITNGKNLLYLSRFFRNHEAIRLIYFIGINRIDNNLKYRELKSNIKYGLYGPENSSFIEIESINCDNTNSKTSWEIELEYLKEIRENLDEAPDFVNNRINHIQAFSNIDKKGGENKIFYDDIKEQELKIRKNSAFFHDNSYYENITQSDVYFTISCVLNNMRNNTKNGLIQTSFVKNLIDPFVFNRFNDGIIQASILRAAKDEELNYSVSHKISSDMLSLLKTFIKYKNDYQGEAIFEFLYALAIGKMRLYKDHYQIIIKEMEKIKSKEVSVFRDSIISVYQNSL